MPARPAFPDQTATPPTAIDPSEIDRIIAAHLALEGPMLPILHDIQAAFGCVPDEAEARIALALNVTRAEVHGVVSFYHDFRRVPARGRVLKLCRAEACQASGGAALEAAAKDRLGVDWGGTAHGVTLEAVYCLGLCACGPAALVDGEVVGRMDADRLDAILAETGA